MARSGRKRAASSKGGAELEISIDTDSCTPSDFTLLNPLEAIRRRPALYIGDTGPDGLHRLVFKALNHAVEEARAGGGDIVSLTLHADGSCSVEDDGRGLPVKLDHETGRSAIEMALTTLAADSPYLRGLAVVNALSERLAIAILHRGRVWMQRYTHGEARAPRHGRCGGALHGTRVRFKPDPRVFGEATFSVETLANRLEALARRNPALMFAIEEQEDEQEEPYPIFLCGHGTRIYIRGG